MAADGSIIINTNLDDRQAQQELNRLNRKIQNLNNQIYVKQRQRAPLVEQSRQLGAELDEAQATLARMTAGDEFFPSASIQEQQNRVNELQGSWNNVQSQVERYDRAIEAANVQINLAQEQAGEIESNMGEISSSAERTSQAFDRMQRNITRFSLRLREVVRSALVFTVISQALAAFREWLGKVIQTNDEASAAIARLKGALLTLVQPLVNVIIPALTTFANVLTRIVSAAASLLSSLFGTTAEQSAEAAEELYNETEALDSVGSAAKKAEKSLAGFDTINKLSGDTAAGSGGTVTGEGVKPDFTSVIKDQLSAIVELFTGAALLALGAILTFSGANIPLGLTLMAIGALAIWDAVVENWDTIASTLQSTLGAIAAIVSGALLVLGAILTFSGANIPLGIGLMVAGAVGLAGIVNLNWTAIQTALQGPIGAITAIISVAFLALGAILTFSGVNIPLGISLLAVGAIALAEVVSLNWDTIVTALQGQIGEITAIVSAALLVLGIILCATGVFIPLGVALIAAGAIGLVTVAALNWDAILDKLKEVWASIKNWWNTNVAKYFTAAWWKELGRNAINGLIDAIETGLNWIISKINSFIETVNKRLAALSFMGVNVSIPTIPEVNIPRLAQGAVIPPNREFLAVLGDQKQGTNIEAPLSTIEKAVENVLNRRGYGGQQTVILQLDREQLGKVIYELNKAETRRIGVNLAGV
nr:MAG TPA: minor tail protein [Caudoviricetes sp.]